jgi:hypothetical protein
VPPLLRPAAPAPATRGMFAAGAGMNLATHSVRDCTRTREGGGSPASHAAAAATAADEAAVAEAAEAEEEVAGPSTTTRASLL